MDLEMTVLMKEVRWVQQNNCDNSQRSNLNHQTTALIHETDFKKKLMVPKGEKIRVKKDKGRAGGTEEAGIHTYTILHMK